MSPDVPRRLPPTQGQRVQNVARTHAAQSLGGGTAAARPVAKVTPNVTKFQPAAASNVTTGDSSGDFAVSIESTTTGTGPDTVASGFSTVAVGLGARARADEAVAIGNAEVQAAGTYGIAIGLNALVEASHGIAIGGGASSTVAYGVNAVAIGSGAAAFNDNEIVIGGVGQYVVASALCLIDSAGNLHKLVVDTSGVVSTVAYP